MSSAAEGPDSTAVRVALWRALHVEIDAPPHVFEDEVGLRLAGPDDGWRQRGDMDPVGTMQFRASIVARARFVEDLGTSVPQHAERRAWECRFGTTQMTGRGEFVNVTVTMPPD